MQRANWTQRSPRLGICAWQALTASVVLSVVLGGATLALPALPAVDGLADLLQACVSAVRAHYTTPGGAAASSLGALVVVAVAGRLGLVFAAESWTLHRCRMVQRRSLRLVAQRHGDTGVLVVPHHTAAVYCIPGRRGTIVFTSAALATLDPPQVEAVLAHERAHLNRRHHRVLAVAAMLQKAFPFVPAFRAAHVELVRLVEMQADDAALAASERRVLATALIALASSAVPRGAIGAGGTAALARVHRLARSARPLGVRRSSLIVAAMLTLVAVPLLIAAAPAALAAASDYCPVAFTWFAV
jgi:Zn-dependent protease with chaperone function